jgi:hypothetical protein
MKKLQKLIFYAISVVLLIVYVLYAFHFHPEVQLMLLVPGIIIIIYSAFLNDFPSRAARMARGR